MKTCANFWPQVPFNFINHLQKMLKTANQSKSTCFNKNRTIYDHPQKEPTHESILHVTI